MISKSIDIQLTPDELASEFFKLSASAKALFFNCLFNTNPGWHDGFCTDMSKVQKNPKLSEGGKRVMKIIGDFSEYSEKEK